MAAGEKAGFSAFLTAFHMGSLEWGVVKSVSTLLLATSCISAHTWQMTELVSVHLLQKSLTLGKPLSKLSGWRQEGAVSTVAHRHNVLVGCPFGQARPAYDCRQDGRITDDHKAVTWDLKPVPPRQYAECAVCNDA